MTATLESYIETNVHALIVKAGVTWAFTKGTHPASPAAACLQSAKVGDRMESRRQIRCFGPKVACDDFVATFSSDDWHDAGIKTHVPEARPSR